jgi:hypothetical protein
MFRRLRHPKRIVQAILPTIGILGVIAVLLLSTWLILENYTNPQTYLQRKQIVQVFAPIAAGIIVLVGLHYTRKTVEVHIEQQLNERFTKAIDQLGTHRKDGHPNIETRIGAIYSLERLARDSDKDRQVIFEILAGYIRQNAKREPDLQKDYMAIREVTSLRVDIQAVLTTVARREHPYTRRDQRLNLHGVAIRSGEMIRAHLEGVDLRSANLDRIILTGASLGPRSHLIGLELETRLEEAWLRRASLAFADLTRAHLDNADLEEADLAHANLEQADLWGANLSGVRGLTQTQINRAFTNERTTLPESIKPSKRVKPDFKQQGRID